MHPPRTSLEKSIANIEVSVPRGLPARTHRPPKNLLPPTLNQCTQNRPKKTESVFWFSFFLAQPKKTVFGREKQKNKRPKKKTFGFRFTTTLNHANASPSIMKHDDSCDHILHTEWYLVTGTWYLVPVYFKA